MTGKCLGYPHGMQSFRYGKTKVVVCENELDLGVSAASHVGRALRELLKEGSGVRLVLAAGESQMTFLDALARVEGIDWSGVTCFNMDEFCDAGMPEDFTCAHQLRSQLYDKVSPGTVHSLAYNPSNPESEACRLEQILREENGIDILCQGIGTSGHLAFNEPHDTDFEDERWVRVVDISEQSKRQLAEDPNFEKLGYIPEKGITMTVPALLSAKSVFTIVPLGLKRPILTKLFDQPAPTTALPASILSTVEGTMYVDKNSCPERFL